uniref:Sin3 histone deacetylase corepressor complex component SDS3 n=1 Tax=Phallusia mammillata TaxID=59560 RepID=A0A6F9DU36_9ASCI|nr:sin3 histone deacetylase corepressor complex component SDS3 [Phallusia mammillata]
MADVDDYDSFDDGEDRLSKKQASCDEDTDDASETDRARKEEATEIKEQMYREKLAQLKQQIEQLHAGTLPEFWSKQKKLEQAFKERQKQIQIYHNYLLSKIDKEYQKEQKEIIEDFETKKVEVKEGLIAELEDKKKQIETERHTMELTGAFNSSMEVKAVTRKLRRRANEPAPTLNEKRRKPSPTQIMFGLTEEEIVEDLKFLNKGKVYKPISSDSSSIHAFHQGDCRIDNGKLFYDKQWFHTSQPIYLDHQKESSRVCGVITAITEREIWIKKLSDGSKIRIFVSQLQRGKCAIKRRLL